MEPAGDEPPDNRRRLLIALVAAIALIAVLVALQLVD